MDLKEKYLKTLTHMRGRAVGFKIDQVRLPNGKKATREYLDHPGAVAVIASPAPGKIVLVKQYRYPVGEITWEIPAGKLERGENPDECVKRELAEETGYSAKRIKKMISYWPTAAFANEVIHIYAADNLKKGRMNLDEDEFLNAEVWPVKKVMAAIKNGRIKDSKTLIAVLAWVRSAPSARRYS